MPSPSVLYARHLNHGGCFISTLRAINCPNGARCVFVGDEKVGKSTLVNGLAGRHWVLPPTYPRDPSESSLVDHCTVQVT